MGKNQFGVVLIKSSKHGNLLCKKMSEAHKAEIRRLRAILTQRGDYWDLQWDLPRLQAAYRMSSDLPLNKNHPGHNSKPCVLVKVMFEIISVDNFSHGYSCTDADVAIVAGDPLGIGSADLIPLASLRASNQIEFYVSIGELKGLCLHIVLMKLRSHIAFPLDELLLTPAGQFPFEGDISLWNIGTGVKTGTAKMRVKVAINYNVSEMGRSYPSVIKARQTKDNPDEIFPGLQVFQVAGRSAVRSLADPALLTRREILRLQISELLKDNERLRTLLIQETN